MSLQRQFEPVLSSSKKIQKHANPEEPKGKKYKTFDASIRKSILSSLRRSLIPKEFFDLGINLSPSDFLQVMNSIDQKDLNRILRDILKKHVSSFKSNVLSLRYWRKKIRGWILSSEKPDNRGQCLIPHGKLNLFKQYLIPEITMMSTRHLATAKQKVLKVFKTVNIPIPPSSCSKHWWYSFLERNTDVKDAWEALPKRPNWINPNIQISQDETEAESSIKMEEEALLKVEEEENMIGYEIKVEIDLSCMENFDLKEEEEYSEDEIKEESLPFQWPAFALNPLAYYYDGVKFEDRTSLEEVKVEPKLEDS